MKKVHWLNEDQTAVVNSTAWPAVLGNVSNPGLAEIRAAGGRVDIDKPAFDADTQYIGQVGVVDGELFYPVVDYTQDELLELDASNQAAAIAQLWQAAHDYEFAQISGTAVGLLTAGVLQALPKSLAVSAWSGSIWTLYYTNKATIESGGEFTTSMLDYSSIGIIPHSIPELREEIGL